MNLKNNLNKLITACIQYINLHIRMKMRNINKLYKNFINKILKKLNILVQVEEIIEGKLIYLQKEVTQKIKISRFDYNKKVI